MQSEKCIRCKKAGSSWEALHSRGDSTSMELATHVWLGYSILFALPVSNAHCLTQMLWNFLYWDDAKQSPDRQCQSNADDMTLKSKMHLLQLDARQEQPEGKRCLLSPAPPHTGVCPDSLAPITQCNKALVELLHLPVSTLLVLVGQCQLYESHHSYLQRDYIKPNPRIFVPCLPTSASTTFGAPSPTRQRPIATEDMTFPQSIQLQPY